VRRFGRGMIYRQFTAKIGGMASSEIGQIGLPCSERKRSAHPFARDNGVEVSEMASSLQTMWFTSAIPARRAATGTARPCIKVHC
jgi:hypothetical protein